MAKKLIKIISENWNRFSDAMGLGLEDNPKNCLMMINGLKPYIELLDKIIGDQDHNTVVSKIESGDPQYKALIEMGFIKYNPKNKYFAILYQAREIIEGSYYFNHPKAVEEERKKRKLLKYIIEETPSF